MSDDDFVESYEETCNKREARKKRERDEREVAKRRANKRRQVRQTLEGCGADGEEDPSAIWHPPMPSEDVTYGVDWSEDERAAARTRARVRWIHSFIMELENRFDTEVNELWKAGVLYGARALLYSPHALDAFGDTEAVDETMDSWERIFRRKPSGSELINRAHGQLKTALLLRVVADKE